nr:hypothetical protein [Actinomycetota bacterium]
MRRFSSAITIVSLAVLFSVAAVYAGSGSGGAAKSPARATTGSATARLKDAKLNIEHNATDKDTGFQGFVDSEGWR